MMNLENMQKLCFIWRHVTQMRYVVGHDGYDSYDRYFHQ